MSKIKYFLFSRDGAYALCSALRTQNLYYPKADIKLLLQYSSNKELEAFQVALKVNHINDSNVRFLSAESKLRDVLLEEISETGTELIGFMTSDDMFYSEVDEPIILNEFKKPNILSFSLRLGENIKENSLVNIKNKLLPEYKTDDVFGWNWKNHYFDFSAPFSTHGHIFRKKEIIKMVRNCKFFQNFEDLENELQKFNNYPLPLMASFVQSKIVTIAPLLFNEKTNTSITDLRNQILINENYYHIMVPNSTTEQHFSIPNEYEMN